MNWKFELELQPQCGHCGKALEVLVTNTAHLAHTKGTFQVLVRPEHECTYLRITAPPSEGTDLG